MNQIGTLFKSTLFILILGSALGCGKAANSDGINLIVQPTQSYLLPGSTSNCTDWQSYKVAYLSGTGPVLGASVNSLRVSFPQFGLTWTKNLTLYVAYISFTITSPEITGGSFTVTIAGTDLNALLGNVTNSFNSKDSLVNTISNGVANTIYSNDPARDCQPASATSVSGSAGKNIFSGQACIYNSTLYNPSYAACSLDIGGIGLTNTKQTQFSAGFTLKVVGYSVNGKTFEELPLLAETTGTVQYAGFQ